VTSFTWKCPHCSGAAFITENLVMHRMLSLGEICNKAGKRRLHIQCICCPHPDCGEFTVYATLTGWDGSRIDREWQLVPDVNVAPLPDFVPAAVRKSYEEACLVVSVSPDAAAVLARRCLEGIIRDTWKPKMKRTLSKEIQCLQETGQVSTPVLKAVDAVRKTGNVAAHMDEDANTMIDTTAQEAEKLIWLIRFLVEEWYVRRHDAEQRLQELERIGQGKGQRSEPHGGKPKQAGQDDTANTDPDDCSPLAEDSGSAGLG